MRSPLEIMALQGRHQRAAAECMYITLSKMLSDGEVKGKNKPFEREFYGMSQREQKIFLVEAIEVMEKVFTPYEESQGKDEEPIVHQPGYADKLKAMVAERYPA